MTAPAKKLDYVLQYYMYTFVSLNMFREDFHSQKSLFIPPSISTGKHCYMLHSVELNVSRFIAITRHSYESEKITLYSNIL